MNTAAHEQDNIEAWRIELHAHQRGTSIRQRRLAIERAKLSARHEEIRDAMIGGIIFIIGTAAFMWLC